MSDEMIAALSENLGESPGISATDTLAEAGRKTWRYQFREMLRHEQGTRLGEDIEELHDMRVATRRMRAAFEVFGPAYKADKLQKHLRGLRQAGRALGNVRDLDVFMEKVTHYLESLPEGQRSGLDTLLVGWETQRQAAREQMLAHLDSKGYAEFKESFFAFVTTPGKAALPVGEHNLPVYEAAPVLVYTRFGLVRAFESRLEQASYEQLHALRIEFKKLRYAIEYFRETLGETTKAVIGDLKKMQDHLGDLNDAHVAIAILENFLHGLEAQQAMQPLELRQNASGVLSYLSDRHSERHRLLVTFPDAWKHFKRQEFRTNLALAVAAL